MYKRLLIFLGITGLLYAAQSNQEFVIKKDKKPSTSAAKEQIGTAVASMLESTPLLLEDIAHLQKDLMGICTSVLDDSLFQNMSKQELHEHAHNAQRLLDQQEKINELVQQHQEALSKFRNKK